MKHSTFAKSALALAFGMFAGAVLANTTVTPITENFTGKNGQVPGTDLTSANLAWTAGTGDASIVENEKLTIDTGSAAVTATIANDVTNAINTAAQNSSLGATFTATVTFVPATEDPTISDTNSDLKFALYAKAVGSATNLYVIAAGGTPTSTGITLDSVVGQNVEVAFKGANTFTVKVGNTTSSEFSFKNNGDISKIEFQGNGTVDNIGFAYIKAVTVYGGGTGEQPSVTLKNTTHPLTAAEATYLNDLVSANGDSNATVENAIKKLSETEFADAVLLNQDVVKDGEDAASSYTFSVTGVKKSGNQVIVDVALNRTGTILGAINGTVTLLAATTPNGQYDEVAAADVTIEASGEATRDATYSLTFSNVSGNFFKAKIK